MSCCRMVDGWNTTKVWFDDRLARNSCYDVVYKKHRIIGRFHM